MRGILAEAVFERDIVPSVEKNGWKIQPPPGGDLPYDFLLANDADGAKIQLKLQRTEKGLPKRYPAKHLGQDLYVVEVQKTRSGKKRSGEKKGEQASGDESTRPYAFGDFDILAVNMHPTTHNWGDFRYTVSSWLIPREKNPRLIEIFQPVSLVACEVWTDSLDTCLEWLKHGEHRAIRQWLADQNGVGTD
jgi:hypothetical protein